MRFHRLVIISFCLVAKAFCMEPSFESIYFKLLPITHNSLWVEHVLKKAFYHDAHGKRMCPVGRQEKFIEFLIVKKKIDLQKYAAQWSFALMNAINGANIEGVRALLAKGGADD